MNQLEQGLDRLSAVLKKANEGDRTPSSRPSGNPEAVIISFNLATENLLASLDKFRSGIEDGTLKIPKTVFGQPTSRLVGELTELTEMLKKANSRRDSPAKSIE